MTSSSSTNASSDAPPTASSAAGRKPSRKQRPGRRRRVRGAGTLTGVGIGLCVAVVVAAPILVGGVHRGSMIALMAAGLVGWAAFLAGLAMEGRAPRVGIAVVLPLVFVALPAIQSIPLPMALRSIVDRAGTNLLRDNQVVPTAVWPLSLDPPNTRVDIGRAAAALLAFLIAYHLASGQTRRHLIARAIGLVGIVGVAIGLGHRILGIGKLYGIFNATARALLVGPFVNSNHTAEFLELSAFVCLACSFQRPTALNRIGWLVGMLLCAGGAAATLSRGAVVALVMAVVMFVFLRYFAVEGGALGRRRASLAWGGLLLALLLLGAGALGAGQLVDRFRADAVSTDVRLQLWRQGLHVLAAHPFGIGRDAFDRVFPIYRSLKMAFPLRFAFVENEPLQLLIDCGWLFFLFIVAALGVVVWQVVRHGRRDKIEAALVAGLFAVLVHSTVDFGLETLGVLLPFAAILGTTLGRLRSPSEQPARSGWAIAGLAGAGLLVGIVATAHRSYDDFDSLLRKPMVLPAQRALLARAQETHPLDYFYALSDARLEPLKGAPGSPSPRLHALNRALRLCPFCETVHAEVARSLWRLGLRRQSLLEWRTAVEIQPLLFNPMLGELFAAGAAPQELEAVASSNVGHTLDLVSFLDAQGRIPAAFVVLDQADAMGAPRAESLLARAALQLRAGQVKEATETVNAAAAGGIQDARLAVLQAKLLLESRGAAGADDALAILDGAAVRYPTDLAVQRQRIEMVTQYKKWKAAARSIEGFKLALYRASGTATDAHVAGARIEAELGHLTAALDEYRIALADRPNDVALWIEYARAAESGGHDDAARDGYGQAARLSPNSPDIADARRGLDARQESIHALMRGAPNGTEKIAP